MSMLLLGAGLGVPGASGDPNAILTVTLSEERALITTEAPHGLVGNETVTVSGNSIEGYNTTYEGITVVSPTTFKAGVLYTEDGVGGTWALV